MYKYQLLFVYINTDQSGGHMWFAVFNRAMVSLIAGLMTLLCYLLLQSKHEAGPFYTLLPLPFFISYFWNHCENRIKAPTQVFLFLNLVFFVISIKYITFIIFCTYLLNVIYIYIYM